MKYVIVVLSLGALIVIGSYRLGAQDGAWAQYRRDTYVIADAYTRGQQDQGRLDCDQVRSFVLGMDRSGSEVPVQCR